MKLEILILGITIFFVANTYYDGKLINKLKSYQKYYKIIMFSFIGLCIYLYLKKSPANYKEFFSNANGFIKYLPIDRNTTSFVAPIIDFTGRALNDSIQSNYSNINQNNYTGYNNLTQQQQRILKNSRSTKRSVSETKKKFVASNQNWCCKHCSKQLPAWFEVDHVVKLEYGGSNNVDNLEALCRECHGKKTALENL